MPDDHWKKVVRDAFIDGRDDDAIDLMMSNIVTWIAITAERSRGKKKKPTSIDGFPKEIYVVWSDQDDPDERVMLVEEDVDGISNGAAVGVYQRVAIKTKRVVETLE